MKKTLLFCITLFTITLTNAQLAADSVFEDSLFKYKVTTAAEAGSPNTVTITAPVGGVASVPDDLVIPATVTEEGIEYTITNIGSRAFWKATMTSLRIEGNPVLDSQSFRACSNLKTIDLPLATAIGKPAPTEDGNEIGLVFWQCAALETINMPNMESIYVGAFNSCAALQSITFPASLAILSEVNYNMFKGCTSLTEVNIEYTTFIPLTYNPDTTSANPSIFNDVLANATLSITGAENISTYQSSDVWKDFSSFTLGVNSVEKIALSSYPNPVVNRLNFTTDDVYSVEVFNILGAKISAQKVNNGVDMSQLNSGIYFVKAKNSEGLDFETIKIIKE